MAVVQEIEKIMVLKDTTELPSSFKYLGEFAPQPREKVVVLEQTHVGVERYLKVRFSVNSIARTCVMSTRHFRTVRRDQLRQRLLAQVRTPQLEKILKQI